MDEKRIKIAESNFVKYIRDNQIKKTSFQDIIYKTYFNNSERSLKVAEELFQNKTSSLWVVVASYYSMFYIACAYIYKRGYKSSHEIVHQVINEALIVLARHALEKHFLDEYEEEKLKALLASQTSQTILDSYELEKAKRSEFQYETTEEIKETKAKTSLDRAKQFVAVMKKILSNVK